MKTAVILETNHLGIPVSDLLNPREMKLVGIGNSHPETWNVFANEETGELKDEIEGIPVMPIDLAVSLQPDVIVIAATDPEKSYALQYMAIRAGFLNDILFISDLAARLSVRGAALRRLSRRLNSLGIEGSVAELGCYKGDTSWQLNVLMPGRKLYLFDTFEGPDERDLAKETQICGAAPGSGIWKDARKEALMARMPMPELVTVKKGWFPETAFSLEEETFALVLLDAGLYQPTFAGLEFFFPRMSRGGVIIVCGYEDPEQPGIRKALEDLEAKYGAFLILPIGDLSGTVMIAHP